MRLLPILHRDSALKESPGLETEQLAIKCIYWFYRIRGTMKMTEGRAEWVCQ